MGYIGNTPAEKYTSLSKQDLAGDGTAGPYTLDYAVGGNAELEIFVNNVRQEPSSAYSVAGNQLTMTGNVASTDDFYVVFQGKAVGTISPPDGSVTSAKLDTNIAVAGDLTVDTSTLHVDSTNNRVGVGTTTPSTLLHLSSTSPRITLTDTSTGADHRINADSSAGNLAFDIDVNSVTTSPSAVFNIKGSEAMRIDSNGKATIGTNSTTANRCVVNGLGLKFPDVGTAFSMGSNAIGLGWTSPNVKASVDAVLTVTIGTASDHRLKSNVQNLTSGLDTVLELRPVTFNPVGLDGSVNNETTHIGLIAHEVSEVRPSAVEGEKDEVSEDGLPKYQSVNYANLVPDLILAIQEQQAAIEALTARVTALEAE